MSPGKIFGLVATVVLLIVGIFTTSSLFVNLESDRVMVIQALDGKLSCYTAPGWTWQGLGHVTKYPRQEAYVFMKDKGNDTSKKLRFNDGGHADLSGTVNWLMPADCKSIVAIQQFFGSPEGVVSKGVAQMIDNAIYMSGPLMSSTESTGERRAQLVQYISDQAQNGVYVTTTKQATVTDSLSGEKQTKTIVDIATDQTGMPKRQQGSILKEYGIALQPVSIKAIDYDAVVENQIKQRQEALTNVQISQAKARTAEQAAITAEQEGKASAARAKWEQETTNAKEIAAAEKEKAVQKLMTDKALLGKQQAIYEGEGEAQKRKLLIEANGALDQKLQAYIEVNKVWASALEKTQGALVPTTVFGGNGATGGANALTTAQTFMDIVTMKSARELSMDTSIRKGGKKE